MSAAQSKFKLISCNVFLRELCIAIAESPNLVDPEFLELGLHERTEALRTKLQERIDAASVAGAATEGRDYDAILLGYGLCGNGLDGIEARRIPLVVARAHDCCTLLLGSRSTFLEHFKDSLSASWSSAGYIERGSTYFRASDLGKSTGYGLEYDELVEKYGQENAVFIWETMHPEMKEKELRYIEIPETAALGHARDMRQRAAEEGKEFVLLPGSMRLVRALVAGDWDPEEFLIVRPGEQIEPTYDFQRVIAAKKAP